MRPPHLPPAPVAYECDVDVDRYELDPTRSRNALWEASNRGGRIDPSTPPPDFADPSVADAHFDPILSVEDIASRIEEWNKAMDPSTPQLGCAACGIKCTQYSQVAVASLGMLHVPAAHLATVRATPAPYHECFNIYTCPEDVSYHLHPEFVSDAGVATLCTDCEGSILARKRLPKYCLATGYDFGRMPASLNLPRPTLVEQQLIARSRVYFGCLKFSATGVPPKSTSIAASYVKLDCHTITFPHESIEALNEGLARPASAAAPSVAAAPVAAAPVAGVPPQAPPASPAAPVAAAPVAGVPPQAPPASPAAPVVDPDDSLLPRLSLRGKFAVRFVGSRARYDVLGRMVDKDGKLVVQAALHSLLAVRAEVVFGWLRLLKAVNPHYRDVDLRDEGDPVVRAALQAIPGDLLAAATVVSGRAARDVNATVGADNAATRRTVAPAVPDADEDIPSDGDMVDDASAAVAPPIVADAVDVTLDGCLLDRGPQRNDGLRSTVRALAELTRPPGQQVPVHRGADPINEFEQNNL